jgi:deoxyadenosine/deoxycytidine kinase
MKSLYSLEGNIAAGKSSLGQALSATGKLAFLPEPVEKWRTGYATNLLGDYYNDPTRWAFTLQICAFVTRAKTWSEIEIDHSCILMERSIFSDRNVFARLLYESGDMSETEYQLYVELWNFLASRWIVIPNKIFYLRTPAAVCLERIAQRARPEEATIPLEFLERIERLHDEWLSDRQDVIVLNGTAGVGELADMMLRQAGPLKGRS